MNISIKLGAGLDGGTLQAEAMQSRCDSKSPYACPAQGYVHQDIVTSCLAQLKL